MGNINLHLYPSDYVLSMGYKSFDLEEPVLIDQDKTLNLVFPAEYSLHIDLMNSYSDAISNGEILISREGLDETYTIDQNGKTNIIVPPGEYELTVSYNGNTIAKQKVIVRGEKTIDIVTSEGSFLHNICIVLGIALIIISLIVMLWKRKIRIGIRLLVIGIIVIALFTPWWVVSGEDDTISTETNTLLIPTVIVTNTASSDVIGGEVSQLPEELTMVLSLISILLVISGLMVFISLFTHKKMKKTTILLTFLSILLLVATVSVFYYAMSMLTEVSVGGFSGNGNLDITLPGVSESEVLYCSWGPGLGFYLGVFGVVFLILSLFYKKIYNIFGLN